MSNRGWIFIIKIIPRQQAEDFIPISNSNDATKLFVNLYWGGLECAERRLDYLDILFMKDEGRGGGRDRRRGGKAEDGGPAAMKSGRKAAAPAPGS